MSDAGIDILSHTSKSVLDVDPSDITTVITLCECEGKILRFDYWSAVECSSCVVSHPCRLFVVIVKSVQNSRATS